jgi:hypothetical protein
MLDMGFEPEIKKILLDIRPDRQTIMTRYGFKHVYLVVKFLAHLAIGHVSFCHG